jgi:carboxyl-terminal processing protease
VPARLSIDRRVAVAALGALVAVGLLVLGIWWGGHPGDLPGFLRGLTADRDIAVVDEAIDDISHDYYRSVSRSQLVNAAISGAVDSLHDPYSEYVSPADYKAFNSASSFTGIGITVEHSATGLVIEQVFDKSPASRAGLRSGDVIVSVGGTTLRGLPIDKSTSLITGRAGTPVTIGIQRGKTTFSRTIVREVITTPVVASELMTVGGHKLGVIALQTFEVSGAHAQVAAAVHSLINLGARGLVLDLRQNGGGLVSEARLVASLFIPQGVIVTTRGRAFSSQTVEATGQPIAATIPLVVLVDHATASSAEIVTGALQDSRRALIVGTRTYGKGVFQELRPLPGGAALKLTVGHYYTPNGKNLGGKGVSQGPGITPNDPIPAAQVDTIRGLQDALRVLAAEVK